MSETKEHYISFRTNDAYFSTIKELSNKLGLDRSQTIRFALDEVVEKYLHTEGNLIVLDRERWEGLIKLLSRLLKDEIRQEITEKILKHPGIQKLRKAAKEGKLEIIEKP